MNRTFVAAAVSTLALACAFLGSAAFPPRRALAQTDCFDLARRLGDSSATAPDTAASDTADCWFTLHVHAVRVSDSGTGERAGAITPDQVARWVAKANDVYRAARVRLEFDPTPGTGDWEEIRDTDINDLVADLPGDPTWEHGKAAANELASRYPRTVLLLFRHGPGDAPTGGGFSSTTYDFVALPGYDATTICGPNQNAFLLAHEIGHYFGLSHTFRQFKTKAAAAAALKQAWNNPKFLDGDGLDDTPPEPYIEELQCGADTSVILNGRRYALLRDNVMSYYRSDVKTLTPEQVAVVRATVEHRFWNAMIGLGPYAPDPRRDYRIVSLEDGRAIEIDATRTWRVVPLLAQDAGYFEVVSATTGQCLTVYGASTSDRAKLTLSDYQGANHQKWRFLEEGPDTLAIEVKHTRKVITWSPPSRAGLGAVEQSADTGAPGQRWRLVPAD